MHSLRHCFALLLAAPFAALAAPFPSEGVTPQEVVDTLQARGYRAALTTTSNGAPVVNSGASGVNFSVRFHACTPAGRCGSIEFHSGWSGVSIPMERVNQWNIEKRYLQCSWAQGKVFVDWDVLAKYSSSEQLSALIEQWGSVLAEFRKFMSL